MLQVFDLRKILVTYYVKVSVAVLAKPHLSRRIFWILNNGHADFEILTVFQPN